MEEEEEELGDAVAVEDKTMINDYEWDACFTVITQMGRLLWTTTSTRVVLWGRHIVQSGQEQQQLTLLNPPEQ